MILTGAAGDGITDDTAAIQAAVTALGASGGGTLHIPPGSYLISSEIVVSDQGVFIEGEGEGYQRNTEIILSSPTQNGFKFTSFGGLSLYHVGISRMGFNSSVTKAAGAAILFEGTHNAHASNIFSVYQFETIRLKNAVKTTVGNGFFVDPTPSVGKGVYIDGGNDYYFRDVLVAGDQTNPPEAGFFLANASAFYADVCGSIWCDIGLKIQPLAGQTVEHVFTSRCAWDTSRSHGVLIQALPGGTVRRFKSNDDWSATNGMHGLVVAPTGTIDGLHFKGMQLYNNAYCGASVQNGVNVSFSNCYVAGNSTCNHNLFDGIQFTSNITKFEIQNCRIGPSDGFGATHRRGISIEAGASNYYLIKDNSLVGDAYPLYDGGSGPNKIVKDNLT